MLDIEWQFGVFPYLAFLVTDGEINTCSLILWLCFSYAYDYERVSVPSLCLFSEGSSI